MLFLYYNNHENETSFRQKIPTLLSAMFLTSPQKYATSLRSNVPILPTTFVFTWISFQENGDKTCIYPAFGENDE
jgi:hypothetical protein